MKIFQCELTNDCNSTCSFCVRTTLMTRPVGYMDLPTFRRCLSLILEEPPGLGRTVNLHNLGESTMHPELVDFVRLASDMGVTCALSSNGLYLDQELVVALEDAGLVLLRISVDAAGAPYDYETKGSMIVKPHAVLPDSAAPAEVYRKGMTNWGGLLSLPGVMVLPRVQCSFLHNGWRVIFWDGRVVSCCHDVNGENVLGSIWDDEWKGPGLPLCETCHGYAMQSALVAGNYTTGESDVESIRNHSDL